MKVFGQGSQGGSSGGGSQQNSQSGSSGNSSQQGNQQSESQSSSDNSQNDKSGKSSGGSSNKSDSGGAFLEISGERGTQNVGIAVFKESKYIGQLSEIESICHLLVTNNVDSFVISVPMENYDNNLVDLSVSSVRSSKIDVNTSSQTPNISISVYCEAKILSINPNSDYLNFEFLKEISIKGEQYLKKNIEAYLNKTSKEFKTDITRFSNHALINFLTIKDWENYNWNLKFEKANFDVKVDFDVTSSLLFSGNE